MGLTRRLSDMDAKMMGRPAKLAGLLRAGPPSEAGFPAGDSAGLAELFRAHQLELVRLALLMGVDLGTAEDVVQDAFERLQSRHKYLRNPASGLAYARSTVLNGCRSVHRRAAVARRHAPTLAQPGLGRPDGQPDYDDRSQMTAALNQLPRRQREVLVLRYYADLDLPEIARTLGIGEAAVRSYNSRGLTALARILEMEAQR